MNNLNIPPHSCKNCGQCCGPIPINEIEYKEIKSFVHKNRPKYNKKASFINCKFRVDNKCSIYPVRPTLCKLMGVTKGMTCTYGNSKELNGRQFMDMKSKMVGLLNKVIKINY